jgi:hypothetical protein
VHKDFDAKHEPLRFSTAFAYHHHETDIRLFSLHPRIYDRIYLYSFDNHGNMKFDLMSPFGVRFGTSFGIFYALGLNYISLGIVGWYLWTARVQGVVHRAYHTIDKSVLDFVDQNIINFMSITGIINKKVHNEHHKMDKLDRNSEVHSFFDMWVPFQQQFETIAVNYYQWLNNKPLYRARQIAEIIETYTICATNMILILFFYVFV